MVLQTRSAMKLSGDAHRRWKFGIVVANENDVPVLNPLLTCMEVWRCAALPGGVCRWNSF